MHQERNKRRFTSGAYERVKSFIIYGEQGRPKNSHVLKQSCTLQSSSSSRAGQFKKLLLLEDLLMIFLLLFLLPVPQGLSHSDHSPQSPTSQLSSSSNELERIFCGRIELRRRSPLSVLSLPVHVPLSELKTCGSKLGVYPGDKPTMIGELAVLMDLKPNTTSPFLGPSK